MFKFQRKHSVGGKAKKAVFTCHTEKKVIDDNSYPIVKDNEDRFSSVSIRQQTPENISRILPKIALLSRFAWFFRYKQLIARNCSNTWWLYMLYLDKSTSCS